MGAAENINVLSGTQNEGYRRFRRALEEGTLKAGMNLTQSQLCKLLDVSLSPLRETLVLLEAYGLVEIKPRAGIHIVYPEVAFIRENIQFRIMIEVFAMQSFVRVASDKWLGTMRKSHETFGHKLRNSPKVAKATLHEFLVLDYKFHREFVRALENKAIEDTHARVHENVSMARKVHQTRAFTGQLLDTIDEHLAILDAIEARDADRSVASLEAHFRSSTYRAFAAP